MIGSTEHADLVRAEELRGLAIAVDDFSQDEYLHHSSSGALRQVQEAEEALVAGVA